jgi:uncharacterized protein (TIGR03067 family)
MGNYNDMKRQLLTTAVTLALTVFAPRAFSEELSAFAGKWICQKTNEDGQKYSQTIEIKKDKFTFRLTSSDGETRLYAEGDMKLDKTAHFKTVVFSNIRGGGSPADTTPIDETFVAIYKFADEDSLFVLMNFDKEREGEQKPRLDDYRKVKEAQK